MTLFNFYKTKNINFIRFFAAAFIAMLFSSCVQDDDFQVPQDEGKSPNIEGTEVPLSAVVGQLNQSIADGDDTFTYEETDTYFSGYVVSSDEGGNFFEELVIQNNFENPTAGVRIAIDSSPLFGQFNFGRKVYVKLNGLTVGTDEGVATLGVQSGDRVEAIPESSLSETVIRDNITENIVPLEVSMGDFSDDLENLYISLSFVQFSRSSVLGDDVLTFASEPNDDFDGERVLESCNSGSTTVLSTSTFSDFKSLELPTQAGSLEAVLGRDFFDDMYILRVNKASDLVFDQERCDPGEFSFTENPIDCTNTDIDAATTIFSEDFESFDSSSELTEAGWTLINLEDGDYNWGLDEFSDNNYALANAFNTDQPVIDAWLITPPINLNGTTEEELNFQVQTNFDGGEVLSVWVSTDFQSVEDDSNWSLLSDVEIPEGPPNGFGSFEDVGPVNLSCIEEDTVRIGFRYQGSDPGITTRYHIDNITIEGQN